MNYQFLPNAELQDADIVLLPIPYEGTVSEKTGTKDAPMAIIEATDQLEFYEEDEKWCPMQYMHVRTEEGVSQFGEISEKVANLDIRDNQLLVSLGGEHSITPMITSELLDESATIVFLDAHADLREFYQGNPYSHATPSHHLLEQGHKMVMAGIRSIYEKEAIRIQEDENISFFGDRELQKQSVKDKLISHIGLLSGDVYLSIDMDAFSPALVPGVGTPQPGGLDWYFGLDILEAVFFNKNIMIKGVDIVELIPEESNVSQVFAAKLLQKIISFWGKSQGFDKREMHGVQTQVEYD